jgi:hypothetical protein
MLVSRDELEPGDIFTANKDNPKYIYKHSYSMPTSYGTMFWSDNLITDNRAFTFDGAKRVKLIRRAQWKGNTSPYP